MAISPLQEIVSILEKSILKEIDILFQVEQSSYVTRRQVQPGQNHEKVSNTIWYIFFKGFKY